MPSGDSRILNLRAAISLMSFGNGFHPLVEFSTPICPVVYHGFHLADSRAVYVSMTPPPGHLSAWVCPFPGEYDRASALQYLRWPLRHKKCIAYLHNSILGCDCIDTSFCWAQLLIEEFVNYFPDSYIDDPVFELSSDAVLTDISDSDEDVFADSVINPLQVVAPSVDEMTTDLGERSRDVCSGAFKDRRKDSHELLKMGFQKMHTLKGHLHSIILSQLSSRQQHL